MKLLVFGGSGQLGLEILPRARDLNFEVAAPVTAEVDVSDYEQIKYLIKKLEPNCIINCAAYTNVDLAETEKDFAYKVNEQGPYSIARVIKETDIRLIHISTDYVFDGSLNRPLTENDKTNPINIYGQSKLAGEQAILNVCPEKSLIVRTSSLHGQYRNNFVKTMLKLFQEKEEISVVSDQFVTVTWAGWLAEIVLDLIRVEDNGIVNASGKGVLSWFDFAKKIFELAVNNNPKINKNLKILPVSYLDFKRPSFSALDCSKLESLIGREAITWEEGLKIHLEQVSFGV